MRGERFYKTYFDLIQRNRLILFITSAALLLRVWGIWNVEHADEYNEVFEALRVCSGHLNFHRWFKRFFLYILAFEYGIYYAIGWVCQIFSSPMDFAAQIIRDMTPLFLIGRITNAILGSASIFVLYKIGKRISGSQCGLLAALFFTFTGIHIISSHLVNVDIPMSFLVLLSLLFIIRIYQLGGKTKDYIFSALFSGLAIQTKLPAVVIIVPFFLSHIFCCAKKRNSDQNFINKNILYAALFFMIGFILGNPAIIFRPDAFIDSKMGLATLKNAGAVYDYEINGWLFYLKSVFRDMGLGVFLLSLFGIILTLIKRKKEYLIVLSFIIIFYPLMASEKKLVFTRYMIPMIPFLDLMAAGFLVFIFSKLKAIRSDLAIYTAGVVMVLFSLIPIIKYELSIANKNTRYIAKDWIEAKIPAGSKILLQTGRSINSDAPAIAESRNNLEDKIKTIKKFLDDNEGTFDASGMVDKNALIYYELLLKIVPSVTYDITSTEFYRNIKNYQFYVLNGYEYAVIKSDSQDFYRSSAGRKGNPHLYGFYDQLAMRGKLIKEFKPDTHHRGERFRIYAFQ